MFYPVAHQDYGFSQCDDCVACCDGSRFLFLPLILDDFPEVSGYFPILFGLIDEEWRALLLLSDGQYPCPYLDQGQCKIYASRPPGCRIYPLSPLEDQIMIDQDCPAVLEGDNLVKEGEIQRFFFHSRWEDFSEKLARTRTFLKQIEHEFKPVCEVRGIHLYAWSFGQDDPYGREHLASIKHLSNYSLLFEPPR